MHQVADRRANIHATCVRLASAGTWTNARTDAGVLLLGPSGIGKSDLALRLIQAGALLVSDDRTELFMQDSLLMAQAPPALQGLLEIRGVGIIELACVGPSDVRLAVLLQRDGNIDRLPSAEHFCPPPELEISAEACPPLLRIDPREASAAAKIAAAVAACDSRRLPNAGTPRRASMSERDR